VIIMPSGYGKDWPLSAGSKLLNAVAPKLLGPQEFASSPGFLGYLAENPLTVLFVDEMGDQLALIKSQTNNAFVSMLTGTGHTQEMLQRLGNCHHCRQGQQFT
jgi:hypothetical protein